MTVHSGRACGKKFKWGGQQIFAHSVYFFAPSSYDSEDIFVFFTALLSAE